MRFKLLLLTLVAITNISTAQSQSLSADRVNKIKACTVRITIDGVPDDAGTGFFIANTGILLTCWHNMEAAVIRDPKTNAISGFKKVFIHLSNNEVIEAGILLDLLNKDYIGAIAYDYCLLGSKAVNHAPYPFFKLGDFARLDVGQEVYTASYSAALKQQFVSKGMVSSLYADTTNAIMSNGIRTARPRATGIMDITMLKSNSGGAIVKPGATISDDEVVGIANFPLTGTLGLSGDGNLSWISGFIGVNHLLDGLARMKK